jgi:Bacterial archaeo-eukaryotic release factor family 3
MQLISPNEIQSLIRKNGGPCVSIFLPTVRAGDIQQNKIRLKNLLRTAEERLAEHGVRDAEAAKILEPARLLLDDAAWWEHQEDGLALFLAEDVFEAFRLPLELRELVAVEKRFHLKPLFPLLNGDGHFYVLALTKREIRLFSCDRFSIQEVDLGEMPNRFTEVMGELTRSATQFRTGSSKAVTRSPIFPGHGLAEDDVKAEIQKFFQLVDNNLEHLAVDIDRNAPFVLAGVEYLLPLFKEATRLPQVMEEGLTGNPEGLAPRELHAKAWEIVEPLFLQDQKRAGELFGELQGTGRATYDVREILPAAHDGRVDSIFTARGVRIWGTYDPDTREIRFQEEQEAQGNGSEDLLDRAAIQTFLHGGKVFAVEQQEVPQGYPAAAIFRY